MVKTKAFYEVGYAGLLFLFDQPAPCPMLDHLFLTDVDLATFVTIVYRGVRSKSLWNTVHSQESPRRHDYLFLR